MSVTPSPIGGFAAQFFDNNGVILSGGKIYTYAAGTTTPQASYTSASGVTPHANPIILDSAGRVPGGEIWLTDGLVYKFVIETAASILIGTYDNITGVNSNFVNYTIQEEVITATAGQTVFDLSTINYTPGTNSLTVYIDGVNQYVGDSYLETDSDTVTFTSGVHVGGEVKFTTAVQTTTGAVDASIVSYEPPFTGGVATNVEAKLAQYVSVKDFGAVGDGVTDDTAAFVAAVAASLAIWVPEGDYKTTAPIQLRPGQHIFGVNGGEFNNGSVITNAVVGSGIFTMVQNTTFSFQEIDGATIENLRLSADYPIRLNDETQAIAPIGPIPFIKKPVIRGCTLTSRLSGVGTGISMSKVFGHLIESCKVLDFDINLLMQGCDIGRVVLNRFTSAASYQILEISTGTFGSQNHIENNDILIARAGATHIKSCARHVRIYDNYIEQQAAVIAAGAIDMTNVGCPQYGPNVPGFPFSIVCQDNRIDGHSYYSDFVYYLDGDNPSRSVKLYDVGTTGFTAVDSKVLKIEGSYLQPVYNTTHNTNYDITVPSSVNYNKFRNTDRPVVTRSGVTLSAGNIANSEAYYVNDAGYECGYNGSDALVIKPTMTGVKSPLFVMIPKVSATIKHPLEVGVNYEVYITARSPSSETLRASYAVGFFAGGVLTSVALTPSYTTTLVGTVAAPAISELFGAYFQRTTNTADIFIQSIQFVRV
jgi:hypothetical protein